MTKVVRLTEQDLVRLIKKVIKEDITAPNTFKARATVEEDMVMEFPVTKFIVFPSGIWMVMTDPQTKKSILVQNFGGKIHNSRPFSEIVYTDSSFSNINSKNYQQIAKQYNIPIEKR